MENTTITPESHPFGAEHVKAKQHPTTFLDLWKMYLYRLYHTKWIYVLSGIMTLAAIIVLIVYSIGNAQFLKAYIENHNGSSTGYVPPFSLSSAALWCFNVPGASAGGDAIFNVSIPMGFVILLTICFFIGKDWQNRTFRNQILAGHGRWEIYLAAQLTALLISLAMIAIWESVIWGLGSALQIPAFLPGQFDQSVGGQNVAYDVTKVFCISFFMNLLIFISTSVIACAWSFIIPNSWGSLGLLYATFEVLAVIFVIIYVAGSFSGVSYYYVEEFLLPYQAGKFASFNPDTYTTYAYENGNWTSVNHAGRSTVLILITCATSLLWIGGMGYLGGLAFQKKDLK